MFWIIGSIITVIFSLFFYRLNKDEEFDVNAKSKIVMFWLLFPPVVRFPKLTYLGFSLILFGLYFNFYDPTFISCITFFLILYMQMIISIDIKCHRLPNKFVLPLIPVSFAVGVFTYGGIVDPLLSLLTATVIFFLIGVIKLGSLGGGDLKFAMALSPLIAIDQILFSICLMFILGGLFTLLFLGTGIIGRKSFIPYGPFLFIGFFIVLFI